MKKSFASGAVILTAAGLAARMLGFVYRVYLSNLIGAEGIGLYELVIPVYTAVVLTVTSGITIAVSKMVAERNARSDPAGSGRVTVCAIWLAVGAGLLVSVVISLNAGSFAVKILGDERTLGALQVLVPCLPAVVAASALKGYFYGMQQVVPTAVSQVAEQAVKFLVLMLAAEAILEKGAGYACTIAVFATAAGEMSNMLILLGVFRIRARRMAGHSMRGRSACHGAGGQSFSDATGGRSFGRGPGRWLPVRRAGGQSSSKEVRLTRPGMREAASCRRIKGTPSRLAIMKVLLRVAVPISANRMIISTLAAAEYILIPVMLAYGGMNEKSSMEVFGRLTGMALPLVMFPSIVTNSIATTLVPALSESAALKRYRTLNRQISRSIQATFIIGIVFASLLICFSEEIGSLVYRQERIGDLLFMLSFGCVFIYLQQTLTGVLNGLGKQGILLRNTVIGSVIRIAVICVLLPVFGIRAYIIGLTASLLLTECLDLIEINKMTGLVIDLREWLVKPGLAGFLMVSSGRYIYHFFEMFHLGDILTTLLSVAVNVMFSGVLLMAAGLLDVCEALSMVGIDVKKKTGKK